MELLGSATTFLAHYNSPTRPNSNRAATMASPRIAKAAQQQPLPFLVKGSPSAGKSPGCKRGRRGAACFVRPRDSWAVPTQPLLLQASRRRAASRAARWPPSRGACLAAPRRPAPAPLPPRAIYPPTCWASAWAAPSSGSRCARCWGAVRLGAVFGHAGCLPPPPTSTLHQLDIAA